MSTIHFDYLDSMRGLACMIVVFFHALEQVYPGAANGIFWGVAGHWENIVVYPLTSIVVSGHAAVMLFFIHSGFVLSYKYIGTPDCKWNIIEAVIKRPIRLGGIVLVTTLPILNFLLQTNFWTTRLWVDGDVYLRILYNFPVTAFFGGTVRNPPLWSIVVELWGSFLLFGICFCLGAANKYCRLFILISLFIVMKDSYYCAFMFGIIVADLHKHWNNDWITKYKDRLSLYLIFPAFLAFSSPVYLSPDKQYWISIGQYICGGWAMVGAINVFALVILSNRIQQILQNKSLVFIGKISFSIYVIHHLIIVGHMSGYYQFSKESLRLSSMPAFLLAFMILLGVVMPCAWLLTVLVDKPSVRFGGWFAKKLVSEIQVKLMILKRRLRNIVRSDNKNEIALVKADVEE